MDTFRAYLISREDNQVRAAFTHMDRSQLDPGDVTVRIDYASINYKDALADNEPPLRARLWERLATDLKPRHLAKIARVAPFEELPALIQEVAGGRIRGRTVIAVGAR